MATKVGTEAGAAGEVGRHKRRGIGFGLRMKIILTFFFYSAAVSGLVSYFGYRILSDELFQELQGRVLNLASIGGELIDTGALETLLGALDGELDEAKVEAVEASPEYRLLSDRLNAIRRVESRLIRYTYLFAPTADPGLARFIVDADVLDLLAGKARGEAVDEEEISHFGSDFDISSYPVARQAIAERRSAVEREYSRDEVFDVNSVSGYSPIFAPGRPEPLAYLGLDMTDAEVREALRRATRLSLAIAGVSMLLSLVVSIILGAFFTRGIIYLDRVVRRFGEKDFDIRATIRTRDEVGRLGFTFNQMAQTIQAYSARLQALLDAYARFVPQYFLRFLEKESILDVKLGDQVLREMTVLFSDIRSFTSLSEKLTPEQNFNFLNSYLKRIGPEIRKHEGFIDKYVGDGIMALFPTSPRLAMDAAVAMQASVREYNRDRAKSGYEPIEIGIGVNTGMLMLGTLGEDERMDGSVISDTVNLCARLESLTRYYGASIITVEETYKRAAREARYRARLVDRVQVKGRSGAVTIVEILDGEPEERRAAKEATREGLLDAIRLYRSRELGKALEAFRALAREDPADRVFAIYEARCERWLREGLDEAWNGTEVFDFK